MTLKVLHVWNVGNNGSTLTHYMGNGHSVIHRRNVDHYNQAAVHGNVILTKFPFGPNKFDVVWFYASVLARQYRSDLLHMHGVNIVKRLRRFVKKPYVLHYHGTDCRATPYAERRGVEERAGAIMVATPDLLEYDFADTAHYLPTIINTDMFAPRNIPNNGRGLMNLVPGQDAALTISKLKDFGFGDIEWDVVQREYNVTKPQQRFMYSDMPNRLASYEYYSGIAYDGGTNKWLKPDSKTALEAMSLGVKVIRYDGSVRDTLPSKHHPENVIQKLRDIYRNAGFQEA